MTQLLLQVANTLGLAGYFLVSRKRRVGFLVGIASECVWVLWGWRDHNVGIYWWAGTWAVLGVYGWFKWKAGRHAISGESQP